MPRYKSTSLPLPKRTLDYLRQGAAEGSRNAELFDAACQFRDAGINADTAEESAESHGLKMPRSGLATRSSMEPSAFPDLREMAAAGKKESITDPLHGRDVPTLVEFT